MKQSWAGDKGRDLALVSDLKPVSYPLELYLVSVDSQGEIKMSRPLGQPFKSKVRLRTQCGQEFVDFGSTNPLRCRSRRNASSKREF